MKTSVMRKCVCSTTASSKYSLSLKLTHSTHSTLTPTGPEGHRLYPISVSDISYKHLLKECT